MVFHTASTPTPSWSRRCVRGAGTRHNNNDDDDDRSTLIAQSVLLLDMASVMTFHHETFLALVAPVGIVASVPLVMLRQAPSVAVAFVAPRERVYHTVLKMSSTFASCLGQLAFSRFAASE